MRNMLRAVSVITGTLILLLAGIVVPQSVSAGALVQQNTQAIDPEVASAIAENERVAQLMEYWIGYIDPFVHQNEDGTFSLDAQGLEQALHRDHPELFLTIAGEYPLLNENVRTIATLFQSMEAGNAYIRQHEDPRLAFGKQFAEMPGFVDESVERAGSSHRWHWYGIQVCYTGGTADWMISAMGIGTFASMALPPPFNAIASFVIGQYAVTAQYYKSRYGGFCMHITWASYIWITRA